MADGLGEVLGAERTWYDGLRPPGACAPEELDCRRSTLPAQMFVTLNIGVRGETVPLIPDRVTGILTGTFTISFNVCADFVATLQCTQDFGQPGNPFRWNLVLSVDNQVAERQIGGFFDYPDPTQPLVFRLDLQAFIQDSCAFGNPPAELVLQG